MGKEFLGVLYNCFRESVPPKGLALLYFSPEVGTLFIQTQKHIEASWNGDRIMSKITCILPFT